ncbi:MAG: UvrD-helicase domain-containing protein [Clostridia bacterium]|nr:UvrD-helicase domain-containing protein [Clostridia bacterium]
MAEKKNEQTKPTAEQTAAIKAPGRVIVSASAGSGKTFVMIEKICDFIEGGGDIDNLLAITFTNKAAAQMKEKLHEKLRKRLVKCMEETPEDAATIEHLEKQISKAAYADVCTIHAFCARLIRTYYYATDMDGIDSSFDITSQDEGQAKNIAAKVLDDLFESEYERRDPGFMNLVASLRSRRSDKKLREIVQNAYEDVRNLPDYAERLESFKELYTEEGFDGVAGKLYELTRPVYAELLKDIRDFRDTYFISDDKNADTYARIFDEMETSVSAFLSAGDVFATLPEKITETRKPRDKEDDKEEGARIKEFVDGVKEEWKKIRLNLKDRETEFKNFMNAGRISSALCELIEKYDEGLLAAKRAENLLDYGDLEHYALEVLGNEEIASHIRERYTNIFVDEYQDINEVQDGIIEKLTGKAETFFVGDVKQAIYGFRGSESKFFVKRYEEYAEKGEGYSALDLPQNFRSAKNVIDAVNEIFGGAKEKTEGVPANYGAMNKEICDVDYARDGMMVYGGKYAEEGLGRAEVDYFERTQKDRKIAQGVYSVMEDVAKAGKAGTQSDQGMAVAAVIDEEMCGFVYDIGGENPRPVRYGDICVLVRKGNNAQILEMTNYLVQKGYPVSGVRSSDVRKESETELLLDILSCVDNPEQDEPLCAFLLSPLGGFTEDELAHIRVKTPWAGVKTFRSRVAQYMEFFDDPLSGKIKAAYAKLEEYRDLAEIVGAGELINRICEDTGWAARYEKDGGSVMKGIRALQTRAYQGWGEMSLSAFLRYLGDSEAKIEPPDTAASDCIRVMTMHAAKGLEFPIVIIADVSRTFEGSDARSASVAFDDEFGFAPGWYDIETMKRGETILQKTVSVKARRDDIKNELNVFYVACTRAMYSLHIMNSDPRPFSREKTFGARCYNTLIDFEGLTGFDGAFFPDDSDGRIRHVSGARMDYAVIPNAEHARVMVGEDVPEDDGRMDENLYACLESAFQRPYEFADCVDLPMKSSASVLIHSARDDEPRTMGEIVTDRKDYSDESAIETGTAYHKFLEKCDFSKRTEHEIRAEVENILDGDTIRLLSAENLAKILSMSVFDDVPKSAYREKKFLCRMRACDIMDDTESRDEILVQGTIDFMALMGGRARIVDYKYSDRSDEGLLATYSKQLRIYRLAVSKICKIPLENISTTIVNIKRLREIPVAL